MHPRPILGLLAASFLAPGCADESSAPARTEAAEVPLVEAPVSDRDIQREIRDLITAVTKLPATATAAEQDAWHPRRKLTLERLRAAGVELGRQALREYKARAKDSVDVRIGLLDVAAHAAPEDTLPVLLALFEDASADMTLRRNSVRWIGSTAPEKALEIFEPILRLTRPTKTYPSSAVLLDAWNDAALKLGEDRSALLAHAATNLSEEQETRTYAARRLGEFQSLIGRKALEALLIESAGNNYLRRVAAQALEASVPAEELCPHLEQVLSNEADIVFAEFLDNMIQKICR